MGFYDWIVGLFGLFVIGIVFIIMQIPMETIYNFSINQTTNSTVHQVQANIYSIWLIVPIIFIFAVIVYLFITAQRREYDTYYQGYR
jgi:cbb3-type cytochrome oxidase subunit 3